jgi:hypothetical protein
MRQSKKLTEELHVQIKATYCKPTDITIEQLRKERKINLGYIPQNE